PDGRTIAFSRPGTLGLDSGIWLIHPNGSGLRQLANVAVPWSGNLSWSPDGTRLAFATPRVGGSAPFTDVDVVNVTTGELRTIARGFDYPTWSSDARAILALKP